jgi:hypothetical protein
MSDDRMKTGIDALRAGRNRDARRIFSEMVRQQPNNAAAWWYLSAVTDEPSQKVQCLQEVLRLEPGHTAAIELLRELSPRVRSITPPRGTEPPILDATERTGNQIVIRDPSPEIIKAAPTTHRRRNWIGPLIMAVVLSGGIVWLISAIQSGFAFRSLELATPTLAPTPIPLSFGIPDCVPSNDEEAILRFVNKSGMELELLRGPEGREEAIATILPDGQALVETTPDVPVRFALNAVDSHYDHSGAIIQISPASMCNVTLSK